MSRKLIVLDSIDGTESWIWTVSYNRVLVGDDDHRPDTTPTRADIDAWLAANAEPTAADLLIAEALALAERMLAEGPNATCAEVRFGPLLTAAREYRNTK